GIDAGALDDGGEHRRAEVLGMGVAQRTLPGLADPPRGAARVDDPGLGHVCPPSWQRSDKEYAVLSVRSRRRWAGEASEPGVATLLERAHALREVGAPEALEHQPLRLVLRLAETPVQLFDHLALHDRERGRRAAARE